MECAIGISLTPLVVYIVHRMRIHHEPKFPPLEFRVSSSHSQIMPFLRESKMSYNNWAATLLILPW